MGASAHPSASGMPPKTSGWRMRVARDVEDVGVIELSDTGTPGTTGKDGTRGRGPGSEERPSGRDAFARTRQAGGRNGGGRRGGQPLEDVGGERSAGRRLQQDRRGGALGPAGLRGVDRHVVV